VCGACAVRRPALDATLAGWSFEAPLDAVIHALKFGRQPHLGRQLGRALAAAQPAAVQAVELLVPVPLHWRRRLVRGYNQAAEIAAGLALVTAVPVRRALARRRPTRPQAGLPFERRAENVGRAFSVRDAEAVRDRRCLLVDDVVTTGATLEQAARALRRAGARSVVALAAARTPRLRSPVPE
jgi:ComF family protein